LGNISWKFKYCKERVRRSRYTNCSFSFWWFWYTGATEEYDGTSWTTSPASMSTARHRLGSAGTQASALGFGGGPPATNATEEWTGAGSPLTQTITVS
jgi:hypothetical protein